MTVNVKIVDDQPTIILPPEFAEKLRVVNGGEVTLVPSASGVELIPDAQLARQLAVARGVMRDDSEALAKLAE